MNNFTFLAIVLMLSLAIAPPASAVGFSVNVNKKDADMNSLDPVIAVSSKSVVVLSGWNNFWDDYDKSGILASGNNDVFTAADNTFPSTDPCNSNFNSTYSYIEPVIKFDPDYVNGDTTGVWVIQYEAFDGSQDTNTNNRLCVIAYPGETAPTSSSTFYGLSVPVPGGYQPDYDKLAYYHGYFYGSAAEYPVADKQANSVLCEYDPSAILSGSANSYACGTTGLNPNTSSTGIESVPLPMDQDDYWGSTSQTGEIIFWLDSGTTMKQMSVTAVNFTTHALTLSSAFTIKTPKTTMACPGTSGINKGFCGKQPGTSDVLDTMTQLGLMSKAAYVDNSVWLTATVDNKVSGSHYPAIRWWELSPSSSGSTVSQTGLIGGDTYRRYLPSIIADSNGDVAIAYTVSGATSVYPSVWATGRFVGDTAGTMESETVLAAGSDYSAEDCGVGGFANTSCRWGEFFQWALDPSDSCTMWGTGLSHTSSTHYYDDTSFFAVKWPGC